jgi:hypothetical protein
MLCLGSIVGLSSPRRVNQIIREARNEDHFDFKAYQDALKMQQRESAILASFAKMRISQ